MIQHLIDHISNYMVQHGTIALSAYIPLFYNAFPNICLPPSWG